MATFGLICEGPTDLAVIQDILCGFFNDIDLVDDISRLQPPFDETTKKQKGLGGWLGLVEYLKSARFRDDVLSNRYVIIQLDSDISYKEGFVKHTDENNQELSVEVLVYKFIDKLIETINTNVPDFYQSYKDKIIFCICVHSLECWLLAYYRRELRKPKTKECKNELKRVLGEKYGRKCARSFGKTYVFYQQLSEPFLEHKNLKSLVKRELSFTIFWAHLESVFGSKPDFQTFLMESDSALENLDLERDNSLGRDVDL